MQYEHKGLRSITGCGISITRGAAAGMSFTFSLLPLTMCLNTITRLRETFLNLYIPFDSNVEFHKIVAYTALVFTGISNELNRIFLRTISRKWGKWQSITTLYILSRLHYIT